MHYPTNWAAAFSPQEARDCMKNWVLGFIEEIDDSSKWLISPLNETAAFGKEFLTTPLFTVIIFFPVFYFIYLRLFLKGDPCLLLRSLAISVAIWRHTRFVL